MTIYADSIYTDKTHMHTAAVTILKQPFVYKVRLTKAQGDQQTYRILF